NGPAVNRLPLALLSLRPFPDRLEALRGHEVVSTRNSLEWKSPPHEGLCVLALLGRDPQSPGCVPLRTQRTWPRAPRGVCPLGMDSADGGVSEGLLPRSVIVYSLAGGVEVR